MFTFLWWLICVYRKEQRLFLTRNQTIGDVVEELRKQCNLRHDTPFNLKYLDVEGYHYFLLFNLFLFSTDLSFTCYLSHMYVHR